MLLLVSEIIEKKKRMQELTDLIYLTNTAILEIIILLYLEMTNSKVIISKPMWCYIIAESVKRNINL